MSADNENPTENFDFDFEEFAKGAGLEKPAAQNVPANADNNNPFGIEDNVPAENPFGEETAIPQDTADFVSDSPEPAVSLDKKTTGGRSRAKKEKEKKRRTPLVPQDVNSALVLAFAGFLLFALLVHNVASILTGGGSMMQTLCYIGTFDVVGLCAASVPFMIYKQQKDIDVFQVMLGVSAMALFTGVLVMLTEFYRYNFIIKP